MVVHGADIDVLEFSGGDFYSFRFKGFGDEPSMSFRISGLTVPGDQRPVQGTRFQGHPGINSGAASIPRQNGN